jgi:hypothetical protein
MPESPPAAGRIFISYRREETAYAAGWLFDRLADEFGGEQLFKDVDSIELGDDFVEVITAAVGSCDVLLALIGDRWLTILDEDGGRRLDNPDDFVRLEIEAALAREVRVIPILVDGARMPRADELPPSMAKLVRRQALELSPSRFKSDTSRLLTVLANTLAEVRTEQGHAASIGTPAGKTPASSRTEGRREPGEPYEQETDDGAQATTRRLPLASSSTARGELSGGVRQRSQVSKPPFPARWILVPTGVLFVVALLLDQQGVLSWLADTIYSLTPLGLLWAAVQAGRIYFYKRGST